MKSFTQKVLLIVSRIPKGSVLTYAQVAKQAGNKNASRAVGSIMRKNHNPAVPCHRVICSNGFAGHYNRGGTLAKIKKLKAENVTIIGTKIPL